MLTPNHKDEPVADESHTWRLVERRTLYEGRFVRLYQDILDGPAAPPFYEHIHVRDGVRVVALDDLDHVVLVEDQFYPPGRRMLHLPGGGVDPGEEPALAAARELAEETGHRASHWRQLGTIHPLPASTPARTDLFLARGLTDGATHRDPSEQWMTVRQMPFAEAVSLVGDGTITEAGSVCALLLAARLLADERRAD